MIRSAITDISGGVIRLSEVEEPEYGDDFIYSIPFRFIAHDVIEFIGFSNDREAIPPSAWRVLMNECHRLGAKQVVFSRSRNDGTRSRRFIKVRPVPDVATPIAAGPEVTMWPIFDAAFKRYLFRRVCIVLWCLVTIGLFAGCYIFAAVYIFRQGVMPPIQEWASELERR